MTTASLSLLKKGNKSALAEELTKPETATTSVETVTVDPAKMSETEIEALVAEQGIETPDTWGTLGHAAKVAWLQTTFGASEESTGAEVKAAAAADENEGSATASASSGVGSVQQVAKLGKKTGKKTGKTVSTDVAKTGEIMEADVLQDLVHEIETMKEKEALDLVGKLTEETELTFFKLGGVLSLVQANGWYAPHATLREWVENVHGLHYRKAIYWIEIYNRLANSGVPWSKVSKIGWTKLKEIAKVLTKENVDEWVQIASDQNTITLIDTVKNFLAKAGSPQAIEDQTANAVTTMTFKVHEAQKATIEAGLAKAKKVTGTKVSTAALEFAMLDYLGSMTDDQRVTSWGIDKLLKLIEKNFPDVNLTLELNENDKAA